MLAAAVATYLLTWATTYTEFLFAALGVGIAGGSFSVGVAYVSRWYPPEKQGIALMTGRIGGAVSVLADSEMLRHIVMNLSLNAIQSMDPLDGERKKVLSIVVGRTATVNGTGETGVIRVSDTGPGIPEEIQHRIFDPFFTTRQDGTGLGLSIVQRIAEGFGGTVSMETSSEGTVFSVFIPLADEGQQGTIFQHMEAQSNEYMDS